MAMSEPTPSSPSETLHGEMPPMRPATEQHQLALWTRDRLQCHNNALEGDIDEDSEDAVSTDDEETERLSSDESCGQQGLASSHEEHGVFRMGDELRRRSRSRTLSGSSPPRSMSPSPGPTLKDLLTGLAQKLEVWESPEDLARLYPQTLRAGFQMPEFSESEEGILSEYITLDADHRAAMAKEHSNEIAIREFCVYRAPHHRHAQGQFDYLSAAMCELAPQADYTAGLAEPGWLIDGLLVHRAITHPVFAAEIVAVDIGEIGHLEAHSTEGSVWVMTVESQKKNHWYRLKSSSGVYLPYWRTFLWLADFAKFFLDFLCIGKNVQLSDFRSRFWTWLVGFHGGKKLQDWHAQCGKRHDFRQHILSYSLFLYHAACSLGRKGETHEHASLMSHPIWIEAGVVQAPGPRPAALHLQKTTVTPNVAASFSRFSAWQKYDLLEVIQLSSQVEAHRTRQIRRWGFPEKFKASQGENFVTTEECPSISTASLILEEAGEDNRPVFISHAEQLVRKVVVIRAKNDDGQYEFSYAWVNKMISTHKTISVTWMVLPSDTICDSPDDPAVFYPIGNELFFSDRCSCEEIPIENVIRIVEASVFQGRAANGSQLFVRSLYRDEEEAITNVTEADLSCPCLRHGPNRSAGRRQHPTVRGNRPKLRGLSLFSGCGLFDHAFTSTGSSEIVFALEHCEIAARSYKANDDANLTQVEIGSVEKGLDAFASGRKPMPDIDFIIGGFPCPSYSQLNLYRKTRKGQKDGSLLANMLSWIDIFLPPYVLMENVPNMDRLRPNACRQAICHLVALGYQVRTSIHMDARLGGASIRERLFIVAAAPGVILPDKLVDTHGAVGSGLWRIRNGSEAIGDLGAIENDSSINVRDPSHVPLQRLGLDLKRHVSYRSLVRQIPTEPKCMSLSETYHAQGLLPHQRRFFEQELHAMKQARDSKCLKRVDPHSPFRTVCTIACPMDARFGGQIIHPTQHRTLSLKEGGRRAMGIPDRFLLAGSVQEQYKQCGNGVPWAMSAAWGRNFARAWFASLDRRGQTTQDDPAARTSIPCDQKGVYRAEVVMIPEKLGLEAGLRKRTGALASNRSDHDHDDDGDGDEDDGASASDSSLEIVEVRPVKKHRVD